jgi:hypothetical protein
MKNVRSLASCRGTRSISLHRLTALLLIAGFGASIAQAQNQVGAPQQDARIVGDAATMNLDGVTAGDIVMLDLPAGIPEGWQITIPSSAWKETNITLSKQSVRSENFRLQHQLADGTIVDMPAPAVRTYVGSITGGENTAARGSLLSTGLVASIWNADGERLVIQPLSDFIPNAAPGMHVVYRGEDTSCVGSCGNGPAQGEQVPVDPFGERGSCGGSVCIAELGLDIDSAYVASANGGGGSTTVAQDRAEAVLNVMNHQYTSELNIAHRISSVLIRSAGSDIYNTSDIGVLLTTLRNDWNANRPGTTRDMAHLFTGQPTGGTIGLAYVGVVCQSQSTGFAYGVSQTSWSSTFGCQTDLVAHELGHNWNANHCTCPSSTMNPFITCVNTFTNSTTPNSITDIDAFRDGRTCLTSGGTVPINNNCGSPTFITTNVFTGSSTGATTDGGLSGCGVGSGGAGAGENDVWFTFQAVQTGTLIIDTCGSAFDTVLSVHTNDACPGGPGNVIVCNDDSAICTPAASFRSLVSFAATAGTTYKIRLAGWAGATGNYQLNFGGPAAAVLSENTCASAPNVGNGSYVGSFFNASNDAAGTCGGTGTARDVWYRYVNTSTCNVDLSVNTCNTNDWQGGNGNGNDTVLELWSACGGSVITCNDDASIPGCTQISVNRDSLVGTSLAPGAAVLIRVAPFGNGYFNGGLFNLNVGSTPTLCPPVNDTCANATRILQDGTYNANTTLADQEGSSTCEFNPAGDVYWLFTSPTSGTATINTCGSDFDTVLSIHSGCPATTANQITCNDQSFSCPNVNNSFLSFSATQGQTYIVRVVGWNGLRGNVVLNVDAPNRATADACGAGATPLVEDVETIGSLYDNTPSSQSDTCGGNSAQRDAWYRFISPESGTLTVTTCGSRNFLSNGVAGVDTVISLFDACAAGQIACNDQAGGPCGTSSFFDSTTSIAYAGNVPVFIRVTNYGFGNIADWYGNGMFRIRASVGVSCNDIDVNNDGASFDPTDIDAFLSAFSEGPCIPVTATCDDIDFNNDGALFDPCDIDSFLLVFSEGPCTLCGF